MIKALTRRVRRGIRSRQRKVRLSQLYLKSYVLLRSAIERGFDRRYGIDTRGRITVGELRHRYRDRMPRGSLGYMGTPPQHFERLIKVLTIPTKDYHFVDVGSGKGRVAILAAMQDFRAVTGVEISRTLHDLAALNLAAVRKFGVMKSEPELLNMDALDYEFPASPLLLYAYNPFRRSEVQRFVGRIAETYEKSPRHIVVAYHTLAHARVFKRHPLFEEMKLGGSPRGIRLFSTPIAAPG